MITKPKHVYGVVTKEKKDGTPVLEMIKGAIEKIDRVIVHLKNPHPAYGGQDLMSMDEGLVAFNEADAWKLYVMWCTANIRRFKVNIKFTEKLKALAQEHIGGDNGEKEE